MFKFNNNHIFTGYLKQLLASFNLPKCKIYTKELAAQEEKYLTNKEAWETTLKTLQTIQSQLAQDLEILKTQITASTDETAKATLEAIYAEYQAESESLATRIKELKNKVPHIIPTIYHSEYFTYPDAIPDDLVLKLEYESNIRYMPYIKDGRLQVFTDGAWHDCHVSFDIAHNNFHKNTKNPYTQINYSYGQKILNYTKNLQIQNTIYDSYTHEYLGDYLRFHRDFANINLMPLYNCFSNRACPHLDVTFELQNGYKVKFKTDQSFETALYKYYMVPVKFFKDYTIAIDSEASIEVCCCIYDEYQNKDADFADIPKLTYQCFGDMQFKKPVLYTKLQNLNNLLVDPAVNENDFSQQEDNLKLILKIPVNNNSSIVILEGDYTTYNDVAFNLKADNSVTELEKQTLLGKSLTAEQQHQQPKNVSEILATLNAKKTAATNVVKQTNKTVINYENLSTCDFLADRLITPLQLLRANTGESYPFADRLIEYLIGNAITLNEEIQDNVVRAKKVISANCNPVIKSIVAEDGIWEPILQCLTYDYINNTPVTNVYDINHDILGFIDKDVEKWYATGSKTNPTTISNIDIYED